MEEKIRKSGVAIIPLEDCEIQGQIRRGDAMVVFKGTCRTGSNNRSVAFKEHIGLSRQNLPPPSANEYFREMQNEITLMNRLRFHPNIVEIIGVTFRGGIPLLIVELGIDTLDVYLRSRYTKGDPARWFVKTFLCEDVLNGVRGLHSAEVVHGDLKGESIIVFLSDAGTPRAKIADFGYSSTPSSFSPLSKTWHFAAPEAYGGRPESIEHRRNPTIDIYGFGMVTFQIAANGKIPYGDARDVVAAKKADIGMQDLLSQLPEDTPEEFKTVIRVTTKVLPRDRITLGEAELYFRRLLQRLPSRPDYVSNFPTPPPSTTTNSSDISGYSSLESFVITQTPIQPSEPVSILEPAQPLPVADPAQILDGYCRKEGLNVRNGFRELNMDFKHPLIWSAMEGHVEIAKLLVKFHRVDVNASTRDGLTPLHYAAAHGHVDLVRVLVQELGANKAAKGHAGSTPLHEAAADGKVEVARALVNELGADKDAKDIKGATPLHWAAQRGRIDVLKILAEKSADVNARDLTGDTPLHWAMRDGTYWGEMEPVLGVLAGEFHANVNVCNNDGDTPLHLAAGNNRVKDARILVNERGARVNARNTHGKTPLGVAAEKPWCGGVVELLKGLGGTE